VLTKGDLLDQERKLERSGLDPFFHHVEVLSDKQPINYKRLLDHLDIDPKNFLMVGNSIKSDILPVLQIGAQAIHIPFHTTWQHEIVSPSADDTFITMDQMLDLLTLIK
jgi:putative hydrolase of the HAD superfamily